MSLCIVFAYNSANSQEVLRFESKSEFVSQISDGVDKSVVLDGNMDNIDFKLLNQQSNLFKVDMSRVIGHKLPTGAFKGAENLQEVVLPSNLTDIDSYAFWGCHSLEAINIPQSVKVIGSHVFQDCVRLKQVSIGSKIESIGSLVFSGCNPLLIIKILAEKPVSIGDLLFSKDSKVTLFVPSRSVRLYEEDRLWKGYFDGHKNKIKSL